MSQSTANLSTHNKLNWIIKFNSPKHKYSEFDILILNKMSFLKKNGLLLWNNEHKEE